MVLQVVASGVSNACTTVCAAFVSGLRINMHSTFCLVGTNAAGRLGVPSMAWHTQSVDVACRTRQTMKPTEPRKPFTRKHCRTSSFSRARRMLPCFRSACATTLLAWKLLTLVFLLLKRLFACASSLLAWKLPTLVFLLLKRLFVITHLLLLVTWGIMHG